MSNLSFNLLDEYSCNPNAKCQETFIIEVAEKTKKKKLELGLNAQMWSIGLHIYIGMTKIEKKQGLMARHTQRNQRNTFGNTH